MDEYIAHKSSDGMIQLLYEHLNNTANLAESFSIDDFRVLCRILGLMHDIGKYQASFQERIRGENLQIEHAVCGAQAIENDYRNTVLGMIMGLCVVGHHTGIPDCGTIADSPEATSYYGRLKRETEDYSAYKTELNIPKANADEFSRFLSSGCRDFPELVERAAFITRYLYSCLTDADAIDAAVLQALSIWKWRRAFLLYR